MIELKRFIPNSGFYDHSLTYEMKRLEQQEKQKEIINKELLHLESELDEIVNRLGFFRRLKQNLNNIDTTLRPKNKLLKVGDKLTIYNYTNETTIDITILHVYYSPVLICSLPLLSENLNKKPSDFYFDDDFADLKFDYYSDYRDYYYRPKLEEVICSFIDIEGKERIYLINEANEMLEYAITLNHFICHE